MKAIEWVEKIKHQLEESPGIQQKEVARNLGVTHQWVNKLKIDYNIPFFKIESSVPCCICGRDSRVPSLELCSTHYCAFTYPRKFKYYDNCLICNKTPIPFRVLGLCRNCYMKVQYHTNEKRREYYRDYSKNHRKQKRNEK